MAYHVTNSNNLGDILQKGIRYEIQHTQQQNRDRALNSFLDKLANERGKNWPPRTKSVYMWTSRSMAQATADSSHIIVEVDARMVNNKVWMTDNSEVEDFAYHYDRSNKNYQNLREDEKLMSYAERVVEKAKPYGAGFDSSWEAWTERVPVTAIEKVYDSSLNPLKVEGLTDENGEILR